MSDTCSEDACERPRRSRGMCRYHYNLQRKRALGVQPWSWRTATGGYGPLFTPTDRERFWQKVDVGSPEACWNWLASTASTTNGNYPYGQFSFTLDRGSRRILRAHRVAYELSVGSIPDGQIICHACDNPKCCNPAHMFVGTHDDNMHDMAQKGRSRLRRVPA